MEQALRVRRKSSWGKEMFMWRIPTLRVVVLALKAAALKERNICEILVYVEVCQVMHFSPGELRDCRITITLLLDCCLPDYFIQANKVQEYYLFPLDCQPLTLNFKQPKRNAMPYFFCPFLLGFLQNCRFKDRPMKGCVTDRPRLTH